jgi:hypothetical protein
VLYYKSKSDELAKNYRIADEGYVEAMNKKGTKFILF